VIPLRDTIPSRNVPVMTWALIAVNVLVFILEASLSPEDLEDVIAAFGLVPAGNASRFWPLLTSEFLHGGILHLVANMWTLAIFGDNVEDRMGPGRFLAFYLLCGLAAGAVHVLMNPSSTVPTVGASGAIAGVMGAYFVLFPRARLVILVPVLFIPFFFEVPAFLYLLLWYVGQLWSAAVVSRLGDVDIGGIAFGAHVGGFVAGSLLQFVFLPRPRRRLEPDEYGIDGAWSPGV
jgi:membrane associated rhomboid family serine protease